MAAVRPIQFANFICRFGEELELLDLASEVVLPAFLDKKLRRTYGETTYLLHGVRLLDFGDERSPQIAIAGRIVKDTLLKREQILDDNQQLVRRPGQIASSPSAIFLLMLDSHKLVYFPEVPGAPSFGALRSTLASFLRIKHKQYLQRLREETQVDSSLEGKKPTWSTLLKRYPVPTLEIVPLASEASLADFVQRFEKLTSLTIRLLEPNNELDNSEFFEDMRENQKALGASAAKLTYQGSSGLDKEKVIAHASGPAQEGNTEVTMSGIDKDGDKLSGNNEEFKLQAPQENMPRAVEGAAKRMYSTLLSHVKSGMLKLGRSANPAKVLRGQRNIRLEHQVKG